MAQLINDAILEFLGQEGWTIGDEIWIGAGAGTTQAAGLPMKCAVHRVVNNGTAGASIVLRSILSNEQPGICWVLNDSPTNAVAVFCFSGEKLNGVANSSLSVTAGNAAVFIPVPAQIKRKGGTSGGGTLNWSASLLS